MTPPPEHFSEVAFAAIPVAFLFVKIMEWLSAYEPALAAISYIIAGVAGLVSIYCKLKKPK